MKDIITNENLIKEIDKTKTYKELFEIPWKLLLNKKCTLNKCSKLNIVILNTPCNGFGDLMFAHKLATLLRNMYKCRVDIASTLPDKLKILGEDPKNIIALKTKSNDKECRRFKYLDNKGLKIKYDLLFVAPVNQDYSVEHGDIKNFVNYSNKFNTYFFSEYNDDIYKNFDFPTGVGEGYLGLLITKPKIKPIKRDYPYALAYIAGAAGLGQIPLWRNCILNFMRLVAKKNQHNKYFELIGPDSVLLYISNLPKSKLKALIPYFGSIKFLTKNDKGDQSIKTIKLNNKDNTFIINSTVFPVPNSRMLSLMKYSVKDILLTGDQSITDGLSCCPNKNIWYQTVPWKYDFVDNLALEMPNKYFKNVKTSCGTIKASKFNSDYTKFIKENNFGINARNKLNAVMLAALERRNKNSLISRFEHDVLSVKGIRQFKNLIGI